MYMFLQYARFSFKNSSTDEVQNLCTRASPYGGCAMEISIVLQNAACLGLSHLQQVQGTEDEWRFECGKTRRQSVT